MLFQKATTIKFYLREVIQDYAGFLNPHCVSDHLGTFLKMQAWMY